MTKEEMFADQFVSLTNGFTDRQRVAAEMLLIGVAFQESGNSWRVISIEGDELGFMSTFIVSETACMLKRCGLKSNAAREFFCELEKPYVTFAYDHQLSYIPNEMIDEMVGRRLRNQVNLV